MRFVAVCSLYFIFFAVFLGGCEKPSSTSSERMDGSAAFVKSSSPKEIHLIEDHSQALAIWARAGIRKATVLHIDAHHDLLPVPPGENIDSLQALVREERFADIDNAGRYRVPRPKSLYGINNYLNAAYKMGVVKRIFWAYPYQGTPTREKLEAYRNYLVDVAVPAWKPEFRALTITPPYLTGTLGGVPVTIGSLSDFKQDGSPLLLDIDLDFFPVLYRNPVSTPYLQLLGGFARFVQEQQIQPVQTVIAYSHNGGHLPIELRYLGPWLKTLLVEPKLLDMEPSIPWKVKSEAVHREHFKQFDSAAELYEGLAKDYPNDPDAHFSLAMNLAALGEEDRALAALEKARQLDPAYLLGYVTVAVFYSQQEEPEMAIKILEKAEQLAPAEVALWDALGNLHHNQGDYRKAEAYYRKVLGTDPSSAAARAYLGDSLFFLGRYQDALDEYQQAIANARKWQDNYLYPAFWLQLARTEEKLGRTGEAIETLDHFLREQSDAPAEIVTEARQHLARLKNSPQG